MRLVPFPVIALLSASLAAAPLSASESAPDGRAAVDTFRAGIESRPGDLLLLFEDALQTNPGSRCELLATAVEVARSDAERLKRVIFLARRAFPGEQTALAEAALTAAPDFAAVVREAFFADEATMKSALEGSGKEAESDLVRLPPGARELDTDIREAIARMTAGVEGKPWPEQEIPDEPLRYKQPDRVRVSDTAGRVDESSLENGLPVDTEDERKMAPGFVMIDDSWEPSDAIRLDESRFEKTGDHTAETHARDAGVREIAPAGAPAAGAPPAKLPRSAPLRSYPAGPGVSLHHGPGRARSTPALPRHPSPRAAAGSRGGRPHSRGGLKGVVGTLPSALARRSGRRRSMTARSRGPGSSARLWNSRGSA